MQRMNSNLILQASQQPNVMAALSQGTQAAGMANEVQDANNMRNFFAQNGQGVMSGDQNALAGLAALGPQGAQMAMSAQDRQREYQMQQERLSMARAAGARAAQSHAAQIGQSEAAAASARLKAALRPAGMFLARGDLQGFNMLAAENGLEPVESMEDATALVAQYEGIAEGLAAYREADALVNPQPEIPAGAQTLEYRAQAAGFQPGTPEYQQFMATGGRDAQVLNVTPDGGVYSGPASAAPKFTEGQSKDNVYATRAEGALALLDSVGADQLTSRKDRILGAVPLGIGREAQSEDFQVAEQAGQEYLQAILRKDTGAAITAQEQDLYGTTYLPQPGDGPRVIEAKRAARIRALEAIKSGMSIQQVTVQQRALVNSAREAAAGQPDIPDQPPEYLDPLDADLWGDYTPDQRQIILRAYEGQR